MTQVTDALGTVNQSLSNDWLVLAQSVQDPEVLTRIQDAWSNFISTGQVWALLIGLIIGYLFRGITS
ncbi:MAG: hypothetical protein F6K28_13555 [Microcoleus sp. SIO2G3]|nr:hypothetical protein [Microcoleus sp. SIO2G3]